MAVSSESDAHKRLRFQQIAQLFDCDAAFSVHDVGMGLGAFGAEAGVERVYHGSNHGTTSTVMTSRISISGSPTRTQSLNRLKPVGVPTILPTSYGAKQENFNAIALGAGPMRVSGLRCSLRFPEVDIPAIIARNCEIR